MLKVDALQPSDAPKINSSPLKKDAWKISLSFWNGPFWGDMLIFLGGKSSDKIHWIYNIYE